MDVDQYEAEQQHSVIHTTGSIVVALIGAGGITTVDDAVKAIAKIKKAIVKPTDLARKKGEPA